MNDNGKDTKPYVIGTNYFNYAINRNMASLPFEKYRVKKVHDLYKIPNWLYFKLFRKVSSPMTNTFRDLGLNKVDLLHFFNAVSYGPKPWFTTFETFIPRWNFIEPMKSRKGVELLLSDSCKKMIAISACSAHIQEEHLKLKHPDIAPEIMAKTEVILPPQDLILSDYSEKNNDAKMLRFLLVGNKIFLKGGRECVKVISKLSSEGHPVHLDIVSRLETDHYATHTSEKDVQSFRKLMAQHASCITFHGSVPNSKVMDLLSQSHVALIPSYAETFGYFVLEAQASGCPVITTNIRAFPEINPVEAGWQIEVPKDRFGNGSLSNEKDRGLFANRIEAGLELAIREMLDNPDIISEKGAKALQRIREQHDPLKVTARLEAMYDEALGLNL